MENELKTIEEALKKETEDQSTEHLVIAKELFKQLTARLALHFPRAAEIKKAAADRKAAEAKSAAEKATAPAPVAENK